MARVRSSKNQWIITRHRSHRRPPGPIVQRSRRFLPVRPHVDPIVPRATLGADHSTLEIGNLGIGRIAPDFDDGLVSAGVVEAIRNEATDALSSHIAEVHRRAGFVLALGHGVLVRNDRRRVGSRNAPPPGGSGCHRTVADASLDHPEIAYKRVPLCNTHRHKMNAGTPNTTIQFSKRKGPIWDWSKRNADIWSHTDLLPVTPKLPLRWPPGGQ